MDKLSFFFPDTLLLAALDLVDRESIVKLVSPWDKCHFEVFGSTGTYTVYPSLTMAPACPAFCTCPAFSYAVLISQSQLMCKHVLAVRLADRLSKCIERSATKDDRQQAYLLL
ncbi:hypothetical protein OF83DRAFT_1162215 [Amylostereum chailletii]|nr:hypothetical protein OF83DRAFT_1162215 [Amylostereum chailletii]